MDPSIPDIPPRSRDARWSTLVVLIGLVVPLLIRAIGLLDPSWLVGLPYWLLLVLGVGGPEAIMLAYPLLTRQPRLLRRYRRPAFRQALTEFGLAIPLTIACVVCLGIINYALSRFWPGTTLAAQEFTDLARAPDKTFVYPLLVFAFTFAPVAEEVYFRGFLQNALRVRLPFWVAVVVQSLLFGFGHSYSFAHSCAATGLGLALTLVYEWRKTLLTPIFMHAGINLLAVLSVLAVEYQDAHRGSLGVYLKAQAAPCTIQEVMPQSAAEQAGLKAGDTIIAVQNVPIQSSRDLLNALLYFRPGDAVDCTIVRADEQMTVTVTLKPRSSP